MLFEDKTILPDLWYSIAILKHSSSGVILPGLVIVRHVRLAFRKIHFISPDNYNPEMVDRFHGRPYPIGKSPKYQIT